MATVLASKGFRVAGVDVDAEKVAAVNKGKAPIQEPGLSELIWKSRARLSATSDTEDAVMRSDLTFVVVPTPSAKSGGFSLRYVLPAMVEIGKALAKKDERHVVVLTSTVMPGSMDGQVIPAIEAASGKKCPSDFGACYNPEFIALGDVIRGMLNPDMVLIGESDAVSGATLKALHQRMCDNEPDFQRMSFVNAELAKISVNSYVTMKMSFANSLAEICESLPGADVDTVTNAIGADKRIGRAYLKGAVGYGGPCFPRDNIAFASLAKALGAQAKLAETTHEVNLAQVERLERLARRRGLKEGMKVAVLGLSYKPDTSIVEQSQGMALANRLAQAGFDVSVYDPEANENAKSELAKGVKVKGSAEACLAQAESCFVMTPWKEFQRLKPEVFKGKILFDCWRILPSAAPLCRSYVAVGRPSSTGPPSLTWE